MHLRGRVDDVMPPHVPARCPRHVAACAAHHQHVLHGLDALHRDIHRRLHGHRGPAPVLPVGGHDEFRPGVFDPETQRLGREAAEDEGVDGADPGDREGDDHGLRDHRQVDDHPVALHDPERGEGVRRAGHLALQLGVVDAAAVPWLPLEVERDPRAVAGGDVAIDAVDRDVEPPAGEPLGAGNGCLAAVTRPGRRPGVVGVPRLRPVQPPRLLGPELDGVAGRGLEPLRRDIRRRGESDGCRVAAVLGKQVANRV